MRNHLRDVTETSMRRWLAVPLATIITICLLSSRVQALTINPTFDASITSDPRSADIQATINAAIAFYQNNFSDPITVTITFQQVTAGLGASSKFTQVFSYASYRAALVIHATTDDDATAIASLPNTTPNPVTADPGIRCNLTLARALGLSTATSPEGSLAINLSVVEAARDQNVGKPSLRELLSKRPVLRLGDGATVEGNAPAAQPDGVISLNIGITNITAADTDATKYSLFAVVAHEIDEVLATGSSLDGLNNGDPAPSGPVRVEDLFRYFQNGARSFLTDATVAAYFSLDGATRLTRFNQNQRGDFADWYSPGGQTPQVQDAFATAGATPVPVVELRVIDALGYNPVPAQVFVDFAYVGVEAGTFYRPYNTLAEGRDAVRAGGTVKIKGPSSTPVLMTITKAMTLQAIGGPVTIGQ